MKIFTYILFCCFALNNVTYSQSSYYWYNSNKIELSSDSSIFYFKTVEPYSPAKAKIAFAIDVKESALYQLTDSEFVIKSTNKVNKTFLLIK